MIFQHEETGLRVCVHETSQMQVFEMNSGKRIAVEGLKELRTECDQPCEPASIDDTHNLLAVNVFTATGKVRIVRVD